MPVSEVRAFFDEYERVANALDPVALEAFFAETCLAAAPGFVGATTSREQLSAAFRQTTEFYRRIRRGDVHIATFEERALGDAHVLATVGWTTTFPNVTEPIAFEISYLVQFGETMRIVAFVSHEDEQALLTRLGVVV